MLNDAPLPSWRLDASDSMRAEVERGLMREGAAAFFLGWPMSKCPPFRNEDHAWAWRQGWRNAKQAATRS